MNHLEYYKKCLKTGLLKGKFKGYYTYRNGLCNEAEIDKNLLILFEPTLEDCKVYNVSTSSWWAADEPLFPSNICSYFGPTRQNIVLFIAAMKGEL